MDLHSEFSPSRLPRIIKCPGSVKLSRECRSLPTSSYAQEGTLLHDATREALDLGDIKVGSGTIDTFNLNKEQVNTVQDCIDHTVSLKYRFEGGEFFEAIERRVTLEGYGDTFQAIYGTLDYALYSSIKSLAIIYDWKFGSGVPVYPDTPQIKAYALGFFKKPEVLKRFNKIVLGIGQPRLEAFEEIEYTPKELLSWLHDELKPAIINALSEHPRFCPSKEACRWCDAKHVCKYRLQRAQESVGNVFAAHAAMPDGVTLDQLGEIAKSFAELDQYMKDIIEFIARQIQKGNDVDGWKLVAGRSIRKWVDEDKFINWLEANNYDPNDFFNEPKLMSPAQAEKVDRALKKDEGFISLINKPEGNPTLVRDTDRRPALKFKSIEEIFSS